MICRRICRHQPSLCSYSSRMSSWIMKLCKHTLYMPTNLTTLSKHRCNRRLNFALACLVYATAAYFCRLNMSTSLCLRTHASDAACSQVNKTAIKVKNGACFAPFRAFRQGLPAKPFRHFAIFPQSHIISPPALV